MVTLLFLFSFWVFTRKSTSKETHELAKTISFFTALVIMVVGVAYYKNLTTTPADLEATEQNIQSLEIKIDDLRSNIKNSFTGSTVESQNSENYIEEYMSLTEELKQTYKQKQAIEKRLDTDNFWSHTLPKILLDFGIIERVIEAGK